MLLRRGLEWNGHLETLLRQALDVEEGERTPLRLDGRGPTDIRTIRLSLSRDTASQRAFVVLQWGEGIRLHCTVSANLVKPYPDRPNEGQLTIQCPDNAIYSLLDKVGFGGLIDYVPVQCTVYVSLRRGMAWL